MVLIDGYSAWSQSDLSDLFRWVGEQNKSIKQVRMFMDFELKSSGGLKAAVEGFPKVHYRNRSYGVNVEVSLKSCVYENPL